MCKHFSVHAGCLHMFASLVKSDCVPEHSLSVVGVNLECCLIVLGGFLEGFQSSVTTSKNQVRIFAIAIGRNDRLCHLNGLREVARVAVFARDICALPYVVLR